LKEVGGKKKRSLSQQVCRMVRKALKPGRKQGVLRLGRETITMNGGNDLNIVSIRRPTCRGLMKPTSKA